MRNFAGEPAADIVDFAGEEAVCVPSFFESRQTLQSRATAHLPRGSNALQGI